MIEKLLNADATLAFDLLFSYAAYPRPWSPESDNNRAYILIDTVLRREYGVSLDDFTIPQKWAAYRDENCQWIASHRMVPKDSNDGMVLHGNHVLLDKIYNEELEFYYAIENALINFGSGVEISFAYKDGVMVENNPASAWRP